ncbi:unnamed protein product [Hymenolepis diminuta]|uniref:Uncharacterized protein n=1 Tax=Hymenolepis diminuta TaxID=6216 RepID=A0A564ZFD8_HYMDI|nr:unnamed protein product [Hymenolepis diminuta]
MCMWWFVHDYFPAVTLSHSEVVEFIRQQGNEVCLLVLDEEARIFYEGHSIIVSHTMPEVKHIRTWKEQTIPTEEPADTSKITLQLKPEEEEGKEQAKVISTSEETIAQTPGITANIVPSKQPVDVPVSLPSPPPPQCIEVVVPEPEKKVEEKLAEMVELAETPKVEELQVKVEELKKMPTIEEVQLETQEKAKIEGEVPIEAKVEAVQEMVEKLKTSESVAQSPPVVTLPNISPKLLIQSRQSNGPRCMASRRACMGALATFGEKAKAFDAL